MRRCGDGGGGGGGGGMRFRSGSLSVLRSAEHLNSYNDKYVAATSRCNTVHCARTVLLTSCKHHLIFLSLSLLPCSCVLSVEEVARPWLICRLCARKRIALWFLRQIAPS